MPRRAILKGMNGKGTLEKLDDWQVVCQFLPPGWESAARTLGAVQRARGIPNANILLRVLMVHLVDGCSLKETALRARQARWCRVSAVALHKRLKASEQWLRWLAERTWEGARSSVASSSYRVRAVDATTVEEQGATGTDWRVHYAINLADLQCDFFELSDARGGETFRRIPVRAGDLLLGDRAYGNPPGIDSVAARGGSVLVRVNQKALPLYHADDRPIRLAAWLKTVRLGEVRELPAWVHCENRAIAGRLVAVKRGRQAASRARLRTEQRAKRRQERVSKEALFLAGYVFLWTTIPADVMSSIHVMELYRVRWQIELAFKRMKSILGLGQLPKTSDASARAWIHGKLFVALLIERLLDAAEHFSPWGYRLSEAPESLA